MKILLTGRNGQLGWELERSLSGLGEMAAFDRTALELVDADSIVRRVREVRPDVIVNAAAYTGVDAAESDEQAAFAVNSHAPGILAEEAKIAGALLVHYSTDYVFDGRKSDPYLESDPVGPLNAYGRTKLAGEQAVIASGCRYLILRTSWVYAARGRNFFLTILRRAAEGGKLRVVADQHGAPTSATSIARATTELLRSRRTLEGARLYHLSSSGATSWHGFAREIVAIARLATPVGPIATTEYPTPALRPQHSMLDNGRIQADFGIALPDWRVGLAEVFSQLPR